MRPVRCGWNKGRGDGKKVENDLKEEEKMRWIRKD
jgi:hypothetical protein